MLRLLALVSMCIDHAGLALFPAIGVFRCIGRISFPLYCYLLTQGFIHTRSRRRYGMRLYLLALASEIPFDLLIFGRFSGMEQNAVFSMFFALLALCAAQRFAGKPVPLALSLTGMGALSMLCRVSFGYLGVVLCLAFYYTQGSRVRQALCAAVLTLIYSLSLLLAGVDRAWVLTSLCAAASALPILLYSGKRGHTSRVMQFFFYAAYPLHLIALLIVRMLRIVPPYLWR